MVGPVGMALAAFRALTARLPPDVGRHINGFISWEHHDNVRRFPEIAYRRDLRRRAPPNVFCAAVAASERSPYAHHFQKGRLYVHTCCVCGVPCFLEFNPLGSGPSRPYRHDIRLRSASITRREIMHLASHRYQSTLGWWPNPDLCGRVKAFKAAVSRTTADPSRQYFPFDRDFVVCCSATLATPCLFAFFRQATEQLESTASAAVVLGALRQGKRPLPPRGSRPPPPGKHVCRRSPEERRPAG